MFNLALIPNDKSYSINNTLFSYGVGPLYELRKFLKKNNINLQTIDQFPSIKKVGGVIFWDSPLIKRNYGRLYLGDLLKFKGLKMILLFECPAVIPKNYDPQLQKIFDIIFTWNDDLVDNRKFFKFLWPQQLADGFRPRIPFLKKKFLVLMNANKNSYVKRELYSERRKAIRFFEKSVPGEFDLYGPSWDKPMKTPLKVVLWNTVKNLDPQILFDQVRSYQTPKSYKGTVEDKLTILSTYKFTICYENMGEIKGYMTEKIWDCFKAGTVPIFLGASNITEFVPKNCFIDRRKFKNYPSLLHFLKSMTEKDYQEYIKNIDKFMKTKKALRWFDRYWANDMGKLIIRLIRQKTRGDI